MASSTWCTHLKKHLANSTSNLSFSFQLPKKKKEHFLFFNCVNIIIIIRCLFEAKLPTDPIQNGARLDLCNRERVCVLESMLLWIYIEHAFISKTFVSISPFKNHCIHYDYPSLFDRCTFLFVFFAYITQVCTSLSNALVTQKVGRKKMYKTNKKNKRKTTTSFNLSVFGAATRIIAAVNVTRLNKRIQTSSNLDSFYQPTDKTN